MFWKHFELILAHQCMYWDVSVFIYCTYSSILWLI